MKDSLNKIRDIINRDKFLDVQNLSNIISLEVSERLSKFMDINNCISKISVNDRGGFDVLVAIKVDSIKSL